MGSTCITRERNISVCIVLDVDVSDKDDLEYRHRKEDSIKKNRPHIYRANLKRFTILYLVITVVNREGTAQKNNCKPTRRFCTTK
jgi:hypothetical protein